MSNPSKPTNAAASPAAALDRVVGCNQRNLGLRRHVDHLRANLLIWHDDGDAIDFLADHHIHRADRRVGVHADIDDVDLYIAELLGGVTRAVGLVDEVLLVALLLNQRNRELIAGRPHWQHANCRSDNPGEQRRHQISFRVAQALHITPPPSSSGFAAYLAANLVKGSAPEVAAGMAWTLENMDRYSDCLSASPARASNARLRLLAGPPTPRCATVGRLSAPASAVGRFDIVQSGGAGLRHRRSDRRTEGLRSLRCLCGAWCLTSNLCSGRTARGQRHPATRSERQIAVEGETRPMRQERTLHGVDERITLRLAG